MTSDLTKQLEEMDEIARSVSPDNPVVQRQYERVQEAVDTLGRIAQRRAASA
jgi:hypothetical protein